MHVGWDNGVDVEIHPVKLLLLVVDGQGIGSARCALGYFDYVRPVHVGSLDAGFASPLRPVHETDETLESAFRWIKSAQITALDHGTKKLKIRVSFAELENQKITWRLPEELDATQIVKTTKYKQHMI